jgi:hypothetical protein
MSNFRIGDIVLFSYPAVHKRGTRANDPFPNVLVLHNNWQGLVHGLNFSYLLDDEINMFRMMVDPGFELKYVENLQKKSPQLVQEFDTIIGRAGIANITSPRDFYIKIVKPFIMTRGYDPYRLYRPDKMSNIRVVQKREVITGEQRASLFGTQNLRDRGKNEKDILKNLAELSAEEEQGLGRGSLTAQERKFIARLKGNALKLFDDYVKKFEYSKGPRGPRFPL